MLCIGLPGNGSRFRGCGNEAGQKTIRGMVFPMNAPQGERLTFTSTILAPYLRRAKSIEELLPWLFLKGISTGDFSEALAALLGPDAPGLSTSTITRLKADWWDEYERWSKRDLSARRYVYFWAPSRQHALHAPVCRCQIRSA